MNLKAALMFMLDIHGILVIKKISDLQCQNQTKVISIDATLKCCFIIRFVYRSVN